MTNLVFVEQLREYAVDDAAYGRLCADFGDLLEACTWMLKTAADVEGRVLTRSELEDLLVDIDVNFVEHALYHLTSLRKDLKETLDNFPGEDEE